MRVFNDFPDSTAIKRVNNALRTHAPKDVVFVPRSEQADLVILNAIGRRDEIKRKAEEALRRRQRYVVIQYCVRSTQKPSTADWVGIWRNASLVWSYYDLDRLCEEDGVEDNFPHYLSPLGVDPIFERKQSRKDYVILTSGHGYMTESVRECYKSGTGLGMKIAHLGPNLGRFDIDYFTGINDSKLVNLYNRCCYVSGLRRTEGFELPAAEGILCGVRPILFDQPHYRLWYDQWGIFIKEESREGVIESLNKILVREPDYMSQADIEEARKMFDWKSIIGVFWSILN